MRTTVDLEPELHAEAMQQARLRRTSLSQLLNEALRASLHPVPPVRRNDATGLGVVTIGRPITAAEVSAALDDD
jgi:hypothetical protein